MIIKSFEVLLTFHMLVYGPNLVRICIVEIYIILRQTQISWKEEGDNVIGSADGLSIWLSVHLSVHVLKNESLDRLPVRRMKMIFETWLVHGFVQAFFVLLFGILFSSFMLETRGSLTIGIRWTLGKKMTNTVHQW